MLDVVPKHPLLQRPEDVEELIVGRIVEMRRVAIDKTPLGWVRLYHEARGLRAIALSTVSAPPGFRQTWLRVNA